MVAGSRYSAINLAAVSHKIGDAWYFPYDSKREKLEFGAMVGSWCRGVTSRLAHEADDHLHLSITPSYHGVEWRKHVETRNKGEQERAKLVD